MSDSSKNGILALASVLTGLSSITVALRFYARSKQRLRLLADDWLAAVAWIGYVSASICIFIMVHDKYLGLPNTENPQLLENLSSASSQKFLLSFDALNTFVLACTKLSALFFYRRIFCVGGAGKTRMFDILTASSIAIVILWLIAFVLLNFLQCGTHLSALWSDAATYAEYCTHSFPFLYGLVISDFLLEIWILVLPIPLVLRIQTTSAKKLSIIGVFALASVGLGASIARMVEYITVETGGPSYYIANIPTIDTKVVYLGQLEAGIQLIAINLPSLWVIASAIPDRITNSMRSLRSLRPSSPQSSHKNLGQGHDGSSGSTVNTGRQSDTEHRDNSGDMAENTRAPPFAAIKGSV